jgi:hypothetical protein
MSRLRNEAHYQLMLLLQKLFVEFPDVKAIVAPMTTGFDAMIALEALLVDAMTGSDYTEYIQKADQRRDRGIAGLSAVVKSFIYYFDSDIARAATQIMDRIKSFRKDIRKKSYAEKSAAIKILVDDLNSTFAQQVAKLKLKAWIDELAAAQNQFDNIFVLRNEELSKRPKTRLRKLRIQIDNSYRAMMRKIDAFGEVNGYNITETFVNLFNNEIKYFKEHSHHTPKKDISAATIAPIPDQVYTGGPSVPMPDVTLDKDRLFFMRDYKVTYHNNLKPGTAMMTVTGRGDFKGKKLASFNIFSHLK